MRKTALITGGSRGIGRAIVESLSEEYNVFYTYQSTVSEETKYQSEFIHPLRVDSNDFDAIQQAVKSILLSGPVSILINNAGITRDRTCLKMSRDEWDGVISVNLNSAFYYTQACLSPMVEAGWGRIVNISSIIGVDGGFGQSNYAAAKAGLIGFTKSIAFELATKNITANAVAPGYIDTDMTKVLPERIITSLHEKIPMKRLGMPQEIASLVRYLVSEDSSYITGQVFKISGGL